MDFNNIDPLMNHKSKGELMCSLEIFRIYGENVEQSSTVSARINHICSHCAQNCILCSPIGTGGELQRFSSWKGKERGHGVCRDNSKSLSRVQAEPDFG